MKLQDKGNRFVIVDKYTDGLKAQQQKIIIQLIFTLKKLKNGLINGKKGKK